MANKEKKRVRWAEEDDVFDDASIRTAKVPRLADEANGPAHDEADGPALGEGTGLDSFDAESSWMDDVAEAERDYVPTALSDRAFVETSEFPIEPFSLQEEREAGFFDEYGNYQLRSVSVDYKDAWLESLPADMGNVNVSAGGDQTASVAEPQPQDEAESEAAEAEELSRLRRRIVDLLLPGETVLAALRRLSVVGAAAGGAAGRGRSLQQQRALHDRMRTGRTVPPENKEAFDALTDASSILLKHGDYHAHTDTREQTQRRLVEGKPASHTRQPQPLPAQVSPGDYSSDDMEEDMFKEESPRSTVVAVVDSFQPGSLQQLSASGSNREVSTESAAGATQSQTTSSALIVTNPLQLLSTAPATSHGQVTERAYAVVT